MNPERFGPWKVVKKLGEGGQGTVFLVQRSGIDNERNLASAVRSFAGALAAGSAVEDRVGAFADQLLKALEARFGEHPNDRPGDCGAAKQFKIDLAEGPGAQEAIERFAREVTTLKEIDGTPGIVRPRWRSSIRCWMRASSRRKRAVCRMSASCSFGSTRFFGYSVPAEEKCSRRTSLGGAGSVRRVATSLLLATTARTLRAYFTS